MGLSNEKIEELLAIESGRTMRDGNVEKLFDYLVSKGPFEGNADALAKTLGLTTAQVHEALVYIRSNGDTLGWTVPYVKRGGFSERQYAVVPTQGVISAEEREILSEGIDRRSVELVGALERVHQQSRIHLDITDGRSAEGKWARMVYATVGNLVMQGQVMLDSKGA